MHLLPGTASRVPYTCTARSGGGLPIRCDAQVSQSTHYTTFFKLAISLRQDNMSFQQLPAELRQEIIAYIVTPPAPLQNTYRYEWVCTWPDNSLLSRFTPTLRLLFPDPATATGNLIEVIKSYIIPLLLSDIQVTEEKLARFPDEIHNLELELGPGWWRRLLIEDHGRYGARKCEIRGVVSSLRWHLVRLGEMSVEDANVVW